MAVVGIAVKMKSVVANDRTERKRVDDEEEEAEQQTLLVLTKVDFLWTKVQGVLQNSNVI